MPTLKENEEKMPLKDKKEATSADPSSFMRQFETESYEDKLEQLFGVETELDTFEEFRVVEDLEQEPSQININFPILRLQVSGLYAYKSFVIPKPVKVPKVPVQEFPIPLSFPIGPKPLPFLPPLKFYKEDLKLDVDGRYPQMMASGHIVSLIQNIHWIAKLKRIGKNFIGKIWYVKDSSNSFKYTYVQITPIYSVYPSHKKAKITFKGSGLPDRSIVLPFQSTFFRHVEFEYDFEKGIVPDVEIDTHAHPTKPAGLPKENLSVTKVFERAGFLVKMSGGNNEIPSDGPDINTTWSDNEMHDAMQTYWSRFKNIPQWSLWVLFAKQHDIGPNLGGIMFDSIGPNHRQGTAIFYDSFISNAPAAETHKPEWVKRMRFWTAVHEMGHAFNLAHSWQKELGSPWIPTWANEPEARSFMNYPYNVAGGQNAFFSNFEYRFSDQELLFMRHAPEEFVQMGNANWFDHHGFEWANISHEPKLMLELRVHRDRNEFEFMEPIRVEFKLKNITSFPQIVDEHILDDKEHMTIVIKRDGDPATLYYPFAIYCHESQPRVLNSGQSIYESLFLSAGKEGWIISEPGYYTIQVLLRRENGEDIISNALRIRVAPPRSYDEEYVAQDYFSDDVARIYEFNGSVVLEQGLNALYEVTERLHNRRVATHAQIVLAQPYTQPYKELTIKNERVLNELVAASQLGAVFKTRKPQLKEAEKLYNKALNLDKGNRLQEKLTESVETLGHIEAKKQIYELKEVLVKEDKKEEAKEVLNTLAKVLDNRGVVKRVVKEIEDDTKKLMS